MPSQLLAGAMLLMLVGHVTAQVIFTSPLPITDGSANYQLSRNPNHSMAFDSAGTLHVTYWSGDAATTLATPSAIHYRQWAAVVCLCLAGNPSILYQSTRKCKIDANAQPDAPSSIGTAPCIRDGAA